jgi:hypothetical protein
MKNRSRYLLVKEFGLAMVENSRRQEWRTRHHGRQHPQFTPTRYAYDRAAVGGDAQCITIFQVMHRASPLKMIPRVPPFSLKKVGASHPTEHMAVVETATRQLGFRIADPSAPAVVARHT